MSSKNNYSPGPINERFKDVVGELQKRHGVRKQDIARDLGIDPASLSQLISGRSQSPSRKTVLALRDRFGVSADWLITGDGEMIPDRRGALADSRFILSGQSFQDKDAMIPVPAGMVEQLINMVEKQQRTIDSLQAEIRRYLKRDAKGDRE